MAGLLPLAPSEVPLPGSPCLSDRSRIPGHPSNSTRTGIELMNYSKLKQLHESDLRRAVPRLRTLREQLKQVPAKDSEDNLLLATWNLRDFGVPGGGFGHGERLPESLFYIAEVLSRFDFVAVQEVNQLYAWEEVMDILGPQYGFIAS